MKHIKQLAILVLLIIACNQPTKLTARGWFADSVALYSSSDANRNGVVNVLNVITAADYYWVGGSGNWDNFANHWATSSGGTTFHTSAPTQNDNVFFDENSFPDPDAVVTINVNAFCLNMDWTGATNNPQLAGATARQLHIFGSLTLISGMNFSYAGQVRFRSALAGRTITSAGQIFKHHIYFDGVGGWQLQDAFVQTGNYYIYLVRGSLDLNNQSFTANRFDTYYTNTRSLSLGSSIVTFTRGVSATFRFRGENFLFDAGNSLIRFTGVGAGISHGNNFGNGLDFHDVIFESGSGSSSVTNQSGSFNTLVFNSDGSLSGGNTIDSLVFHGSGTINTNANNIIYAMFHEAATINGNGTYGQIILNRNGDITGSNSIGNLELMPGNLYRFTENTTQLITGSLTANGTCAQRIILTSTSANHATISKLSGSVTVSYCIMGSMNGSGGASFAANQTIDMGNNLGWVISAPTPIDLYWVGGSGDWSDPENWSLSSGGPGGACIPSSLDNVFFDANSFDAPGQIVTLTGGGDNSVRCRHMNWTGATNYPTLSSASNVNLRIFGSLTFIPDMNLNHQGILRFDANEPEQTVTTAGLSLAGIDYLSFAGEGGEWTLTDGLDIGNNILYLQRGTLNTNNQPITAGRLLSNYTTTRALNLGSSEITLSSTSNHTIRIDGTNMTLDAGTSLIRMTGSGTGIYNIDGGGLFFYDVICEATTGTVNIYNLNGGFNTLIIKSTGTNSLRRSNTVDSLYFAGNAAIWSDNNQINKLVADANWTLTSSTNGNYEQVTVAGNASLSGSNTYGNMLINGNATISGNSNYGDLNINGTATISGNSTYGSVSIGGTATVGGNSSYNNLSLNGNASITGDNTFGSLIFNAGNQYTLNTGRTQTILNDFIANGTETELIIIRSNSFGNQTALHKESGAVTVEHVTLQDNIATGGATFIANNSYDLGNNTGWIINEPAGKDYYWVGGTGNWDDVNNWSLSSGGPGGAGMPTLLDNVFFDANSFSAPGQVVTLIGDGGNNASCLNMDWTGVTNHPTLSGASTVNLRIYGSLTFVPDMHYDFDGRIRFDATEPGQTFFTAELDLDKNDIYFQGEGGEWTLVGSLNIGTQILYHVRGTLNTNNHPITAGRLLSDYKTIRVLNLGSSEITLSSTSNHTIRIDGTNMTLDAGTSLIRMTGSGTGIYNIDGGGLFFYDVICEATTGTVDIYNLNGGFNTLVIKSTGSSTLRRSNTVDSLYFAGNATIWNNNNNINKLVFGANGTIDGSNGIYGHVIINGNGSILQSNTFTTLEFTPGNTYTLSSGRTQTILQDLIANGTCAEPISILSSSTTAQTTISKSEGTITIDQVSLRRVTATGGADFIANNAIDLGNNPGWTINPPGIQNLYWVGGSGQWNNINNWSNESGGPGGYCIPGFLDNVIFDENSFWQTGQTVTINVSDAYCRDMDWSNASFSPTLNSSSSNNNLRIYGSLTLNPAMNFNFTGVTIFQGGNPPEGTYNIKMAGKSFANHIHFANSTGVWTLEDALNLGSNILYINSGALATNNQIVSCSRFISTTNNFRVLDMGSSLFMLNSSNSQTWNLTGSNFNILAGTSEIRLTSANAGFRSTGASDLKYNKVTFMNPGGESALQSDDEFGMVEFHPNSVISGGAIVDDVIFFRQAQITENNSFGRVRFADDATIGGNNTFERLILAPGRSYVFQSESIQTIENRFFLWGRAVNPINISSSVAGNPATISKSTGEVLGNYVNLQDMTATGGAIFNLYSSVDMGNNTGWNFLGPTYGEFSDVLIYDSQSECYEATETITVGGPDGNFEVENGGSVTFIAGFSVQILPGTTVASGGHFHAQITPYGLFCDTITTMLASSSFHGYPDAIAAKEILQNNLFSVFPNPSTGLINIELIRSDDFFPAVIEVINMFGATIARYEHSGSSQSHFNLSGHPAGIYLIRVVMGDEVGVKKLIKQ